MEGAFSVESSAYVLKPVVRRYKYRNGERIMLKNGEALKARLNSEIPLELHETLIRACHKAGISKADMVSQMIVHCLGDIQKIDDADNAPF